MIEKKLFILGDSISIDYTPFIRKYLGNKWGVLRKGDLPAPEIPGELDSANGTDSSVVLRYMEAVLPQIPAALILLNCGLHDVKRLPDETNNCLNSLDQYQKNLSQILRLVQDSKKQVLWVATTPVNNDRHRRYENSFFRFNEDVIAYNEIARSLMLANGIPYIDLYAFTMQIEQPLYRDHVHFYEQISEWQAVYLCGAIDSIFQNHEGHFYEFTRTID